MIIFETERLSVRRINASDASFMFKLMNDPSWIRFIGDRGIRTIADAENNIAKGPVAMYERIGFGLFLVALKTDGCAIGICGPLKRDTLPDVDLGFAFLPEYSGKGYALEAATGALDYVKRHLGMRRILAITMPGNLRSLSLLKKLGFRYENDAQLSPSAPPIQIHAIEL